MRFDGGVACLCVEPTDSMVLCLRNNRPFVPNGSDDMRIVVASSEAVPFSKTGGLADVASALPKALAQAGHEVTLIVPHYPQIQAKNPDAPLVE